MATLRATYQAYLQPDHGKPRTQEAFLNTATHWERAELTIPAGSPGERITTRDPDLAAIDNVTLLDFKRYLSNAVNSPNTVRKYLKHLLVILHRVGPEDFRNPGGLGLIPKVPYVQLPKEVRGRPNIVEKAEVEALYRAAEWATWPDSEIDPRAWWRSLIVTLFNMGLRRSDFLSTRMEEFDLDRGVLLFDAEKTGKVAELPLHEAVVQHLREIWTPARALVWPWRRGQAGPEPIHKKKTSFYAQWHRLRTSAGITRRITPHDLRRTCGSDLFAISPAAASECLQHASIVTTQRSYVNCTRETRDLMLARPQPAAFTTLGDGPDDGPAILPFPKIG